MTPLIQLCWHLLTAALFTTSSTHIHLRRSQPAANDTLAAAPTALRFWFSERPELAVTMVKLTSAAGTSVSLAPIAVDTGANAPLVSAVRGQVPAGTYAVSWKTTATDGHPASGTFNFVVSH
jgi:methionine-rich copper-binding protein CopC